MKRFMTAFIGLAGTGAILSASLAATPATQPVKDSGATTAPAQQTGGFGGAGAESSRMTTLDRLHQRRMDELAKIAADKKVAADAASNTGGAPGGPVAGSNTGAVVRTVSSNSPATMPAKLEAKTDTAKVDSAKTDTANNDGDKGATANGKKLPTPAELMAQIQKSRDQQKRVPEVAYFDLGTPISEKPAAFSLFGGESLTLRVLIDRLEKARADKQVRGVLITLGDPGLNLSQAMELRDSLNDLRKAGKRTFVYADSFDTDSYVAASGATDICMLGGGDIEIPGVGFETMFAKGLLDKVGVKADYVQIGEYKGADEEYTRSNASDELRGQLNGLADSLYAQIIDTISLSRNLTHEDVKSLVDDCLIPGKVAKDRGLVDHLVDVDGLRDLVTSQLGAQTELVGDYGQPPKENVDLSSPLALLSLLSKKPVESTNPAIAIIYAEGVIVDGQGGGNMLTQEDNIGSEEMRDALRMAERDSKVKAIVIRIDSPGGSALASEVMWQAARRVAKTKPVIISVGSMAASGGYYLASSGDYIFADPTAIVGSIGVVGGKFVTADLYKTLGLTTESFMRGKNAGLFSSNTEWTDDQRRLVTNWMHQTYDQFTERVMTTRDGKIKDIDAVARGRIFSAKQALNLGMVDAIGGVSDAINYSAEQVDLKPGTYDVEVLPPPRTLADIIAASAGADAKMPFTPKIELSADSVLNALSPSTRHALGEEIELLTLLQQHPVLLASPVVFTVK
jgi:protease-4